MKPLKEICEDKILKKHHDSMIDRFGGPVPVKKFLEEFLPAGKLPSPGRPGFSKIAQSRNSETACHALMRAGGHLFPNFKFMHISSSLNGDITDGLRPPVACYLSHIPRIRGASDDWQHMEMFVVFGEKNESDPWLEDPNSNDTYTDSSWKARARNIAYSKAQFSHQHRTFFFSLAFYRRTARFFRWDRAGVLVTEAFDYVHNRELLIGFLQRFNGLSPGRRGWDTAARPALPAESALLTSSIKAYLVRVKARQIPMLKDLHETLDRRFPAYKIRLDQGKCGQSCEIIVRKPFFVQGALLGRATQGYIGFHLGEKRLVFLKDCWADDRKQQIKEVDVYCRLVGQDIPHLPAILYAGYVKGAEGARQDTITGSCCSRGQYPWAPDHFKMRRRVHIRIAQDILYPIDHVCSSRQLVSTIRDALKAIQAASDRAGLLHCDISVSNIMVNVDGDGVLNDWDSTRTTDSEEMSPVGTWQFASMLTIPGSLRQHVIQDDVEACFWVLIHQSSSLCEFDQLLGLPGSDIYRALFADLTGRLKKEFLMDHTLSAPQFESAPLNELINELRALFRAYHAGSNPTMDANNAIALFDKALQRTDWPELDTIIDEPVSKTRGRRTDAREYVSDLVTEELRMARRVKYLELLPICKKPSKIQSAILAPQRSAPVETNAEARVQPDESALPPRLRKRAREELAASVNAGSESESSELHVRKRARVEC